MLMLILLLWDLSTLCVVDYLWPLILCSLLSFFSTLWFIGTSNVQPYIMWPSAWVATKPLWWKPRPRIVFMITYILRSSSFCEICTLCCGSLMTTYYIEQTLVFLLLFILGKICKVDSMPDECNGRKLKVAYQWRIDFSFPLFYYIIL